MKSLSHWTKAGANAQYLPRCRTTDEYTLLRPESRGDVDFRSGNVVDAPVIQPNFLTTEKDQKTLIQGLRQAIEVVEADAFGPYRQRIQTPVHHPSDDGL